MAHPTLNLALALRKSAQKIKISPHYQWGHMGCCNCGFLVQEVTSLTQSEIHRRAMMKHGDWNEQLNDYCPTSGQPMDDMISELISFGFDTTDLKHLEKLSDPEILKHIPGKNLLFNVRDDVAKYLLTWAEMIENRLLTQVSLTSFEKEISLMDNLVN